MSLKSILGNQKEIKYRINNKPSHFQIVGRILKFCATIKDFHFCFIMIIVNKMDAKFCLFILHFKMKYNSKRLIKNFNPKFRLIIILKKRKGQK